MNEHESSRSVGRYVVEIWLEYLCAALDGVVSVVIKNRAKVLASDEWLHSDASHASKNLLPPLPLFCPSYSAYSSCRTMSSSHPETAM